MNEELKWFIRGAKYFVENPDATEWDKVPKELFEGLLDAAFGGLLEEYGAKNWEQIEELLGRIYSQELTTASLPDQKKLKELITDLEADQSQRKNIREEVEKQTRQWIGSQSARPHLKTEGPTKEKVIFSPAHLPEKENQEETAPSTHGIAVATATSTAPIIKDQLDIIIRDYAPALKKNDRARELVVNSLYDAILEQKSGTKPQGIEDLWIETDKILKSEGNTVIPWKEGVALVQKISQTLESIPEIQEQAIDEQTEGTRTTSPSEVAPLIKRDLVKNLGLLDEERAEKISGEIAQKVTTFQGPPEIEEIGEVIVQVLNDNGIVPAQEITKKLTTDVFASSTKTMVPEAVQTASETKTELTEETLTPLVAKNVANNIGLLKREETEKISSEVAQRLVEEREPLNSETTKMVVNEVLQENGIVVAKEVSEKLTTEVLASTRNASTPTERPTPVEESIFSPEVLIPSIQKGIIKNVPSINNDQAEKISGEVARRLVEERGSLETETVERVIVDVLKENDIPLKEDASVKLAMEVSSSAKTIIEKESQPLVKPTEKVVPDELKERVSQKVELVVDSFYPDLPKESKQRVTTGITEEIIQGASKQTKNTPSGELQSTIEQKLSTLEKDETKRTELAQKIIDESKQEREIIGRWTATAPVAATIGLAAAAKEIVVVKIPEELKDRLDFSINEALKSKNIPQETQTKANEAIKEAIIDYYNSPEPRSEKDLQSAIKKALQEKANIIFLPEKDVQEIARKISQDSETKAIERWIQTEKLAPSIIKTINESKTPEEKQVIFEERISEKIELILGQQHKDLTKDPELLKSLSQKIKESVVSEAIANPQKSISEIFITVSPIIGQTLQDEGIGLKKKDLQKFVSELESNTKNEILFIRTLGVNTALPPDILEKLSKEETGIAFSPIYYITQPHKALQVAFAYGQRALLSGPVKMLGKAAPYSSEEWQTMIGRGIFAEDLERTIEDLKRKGLEETHPAMLKARGLLEKLSAVQRDSKGRDKPAVKLLKKYYEYAKLTEKPFYDPRLKFFLSKLSVKPIWQTGTLSIRIRNALNRFGTETGLYKKVAMGVGEATKLRFEAEAKIIRTLTGGRFSSVQTLQRTVYRNSLARTIRFFKNSSVGRKITTTVGKIALKVSVKVAAKLGVQLGIEGAALMAGVAAAPMTMGLSILIPILIEVGQVVIKIIKKIAVRAVNTVKKTTKNLIMAAMGAVAGAGILIAGVTGGIVSFFSALSIGAFAAAPIAIFMAIFYLVLAILTVLIVIISAGAFILPVGTKEMPWTSYRDPIVIPTITPIPGITFNWPVSSPETCSSNFGYGGLRGNCRFHYGIDIPAACGASIQSVAPGRVFGRGILVYDGRPNTGYGHYIIIDHGGVFTLYAHLKPDGQLPVGSEVTGSTTIARVDGNPNADSIPGNSTACHLHLEFSTCGDIARGCFNNATYMVDPCVNLGNYPACQSAGSCSYRDRSNCP